MELKELTDRTLELFGVTAPEQLGPALLAACGDPDKLRSFCKLVDNDLSTDWMQKIYRFILLHFQPLVKEYGTSGMCFPCLPNEDVYRLSCIRTGS